MPKSDDVICERSLTYFIMCYMCAERNKIKLRRVFSTAIDLVKALGVIVETGKASLAFK